MTDTERTVVGRECRFAMHIKEKYGVSPDLHLVKEQVHYSDGSIEPNLRWIKEFKRPYYITAPNKRFHKQKNEWTSLDNVIIKECTQSQLRDRVAQGLDMRWSKDHLKKLARSPYLYGTDISSTALIKKQYMDKYPGLNTLFGVATYDIETDVVNGTREAIMATVIFKDKIYICVQQSFVKGFANLETLVDIAAKKYIGKYLDANKMTIELYVADGVVDLIGKSFAKVHEWKPDFLAIWNMDFDIPEILRMLEEKGEDPRDYLCDPSVPKDLRVCKYKQGPKNKTTASGKFIPINPAAQWHTLEVTASYYVIDAMCAYKHIRLGEQEEVSYSLNYILNKKLGIRKLSFEQADQYSGLQWHEFMQMNFKIEYMIYNIFDCLSMIELDKMTKDLCSTVPTFSATSDFVSFKSQPKRIVDALHYFALSKGYVMGTVGSADEEPVIEEVTDEDGVIEETQAEAVREEKTLGLDDWIN